ncbi:hypothetical protein NLJ89_g9071 [Agrocybe chaxingu]|uniref:Uncharacterized protein n=1 Tax=Agrocybe chaxingu TaxID=84603 RepID=A0A9W8K0N1_9AGAR|nr:hypothetical protein NLJ89_g9071 [Agrocybe chaxingu]
MTSTTPRSLREEASSLFISVQFATRTYMTCAGESASKCEDGDDALRHSSVIELVEPSVLAAACMGSTKQWSASVDWRVDAIDIIGGVYGTKFALWDISKLRGGTPTVTGNTFPEGGQIFRQVFFTLLPCTSFSFFHSWCPTYPEHFAISTQSPTKGAIIHVHNCNFVHAPPTPFVIRPRPHFIRAFDFLSMGGIPRIAAAVGRSVIVFSIGVDT